MAHRLDLETSIKTRPDDTWIESWFETAMHVCKWHAERGDAHKMARYLNDLEAMELLTTDEAAQVRKACGLVVQRRLFDE